MKIALFVLGLCFVSALAQYELPARPLRFKHDQVYKYDYSGHVLTGIPVGSSLYSGFQLNATVELGVYHINKVNDEDQDAVKMQLTNIVLGHLTDEVIDEVNAKFEQEKVTEVVKSLLSIPVQFAFDHDHNTFSWLDVKKSDAPWSINIKKSIIDLLQVDFLGVNAHKVIRDDEDYEMIKETQTNGVSAFGVYEKTIKGECETNYEVLQTVDPVHLENTLRGAEKLHWTVTKTRNYANCIYTPVYSSHNWDRKGCVEYCKRYTGSSHVKLEHLNKYLPIPDEEKSNCVCDPKEARPVEQFSTIRYNITYGSQDEPVITEAVGTGKIVVDNHGTKFVVHTRHSIRFADLVSKKVNKMPENDVIRVHDLTLTLYPYQKMDKQAYPSHVVPVHNLLVPRNYEDLVSSTVDLFSQVVEIVKEQAEESMQSKAAWYMIQVVQNMHHMSHQEIEQIWRENALVESEKRYTNTKKAIFRQLFLDALAHVGNTKATVEWLETVIAEKALSSYELRQFVETLPRNVHAPSRTLLILLQKQIEAYVDSEKWNQLSALVISYGKLISKACRGDLKKPSDPINFWYDIKRNDRSMSLKEGSEIDWPESDQLCNQQDVDRYINGLHKLLKKAVDLKGKISLAQALTHTGRIEALQILTPYITGTNLEADQCVGYKNASTVSECNFLRSSIIYALHHMVPVSPKLLRSLVLPVFHNKLESYELRLAAFTVFMAAGPRRHELESVAAFLKNENNRQVITMVRSILEETANLTQACHLPLAQAAREIIPTLPEYNFEGVYSQASYNEWYSQDRSTGFYLNGQFVANNMSLIPRHGYLSLGSHWKSLSNSWFTVAYQQKGLEPVLMAKLKQVFSPEWFMTALAKSGRGEKAKHPIDELFRELGISERAEEEVKVKLFVKLYEQTSLFTLDRWTIEAAYNQFRSVVENYIKQLDSGVEYNYVRFFMPSTYTDVIPSEIGLPVVVMKQQPHIVALRVEKPSTKIDMSAKKTFAFQATFVPQVYMTSSMSVSAFHQGIEKNAGACSLKKTILYLPVRVGFSFEAPTISYRVEPVLGLRAVQFKNTNRGYQAINHIGLEVNESPFSKKVLIQSLAHSFPTSKKVSVKELGMAFEIESESERPWFLDVEKIPAKGIVSWILEKYTELNSFNYDLRLTPTYVGSETTVGIEGSFSYNFAFGGNYISIKDAKNMIKKSRSLILEDVSIGREEIRKVAEYMTNKYVGINENKQAPTLTRALTWSFRTLSDETRYNATLYFIQALDYQTYWVKYVQTLDKRENLWFGLPRAFQVEASVARKPLLSELKWPAPQFEEFFGRYVAKLSWGQEIDTDVEPKIVIMGDLQRTDDDEIIDAKLIKSWYHEQCDRDIKNEVYMSYACQIVAETEAYFNMITGTIKFNQLKDSFVNVTEKVYDVVKYGLTSYWRPWSTIRSYADSNDEGQITFEAKHSNAIRGHPVINFKVQTPRETSIWNKLFFPIQRFTGFFPPMYQKASVLPADQTCGLMVNHVRTFDNVTFEKPESDCEVLLAMDCSANRRFAVTVKDHSDSEKKREVKVVFGRHVVIVKKAYDDNAKHAIIEINGENKYVKEGQSHVIERSLEITSVRIFVQNSFVVIELPQEHVRVVTDGLLVKVVTSPIYVGKTCGLCGNQDQEAHMEFQGPENCYYDNVKDYQNSYSLGECHNVPKTVPPTCLGAPHHRRISKSEQIKRVHAKWAYPYSAVIDQQIERFEKDEDSYREDNLLPIRKTYWYKNAGNRLCFSKRPVPACKPDEVASQTYTMSIAMVCFPNHPAFEQWAEAEWNQVIYQTSTYAVTDYLDYETPITCLKRERQTRGI